MMLIIIDLLISFEVLTELKYAPFTDKIDLATDYIILSCCSVNKQK